MTGTVIPFPARMRPLPDGSNDGGNIVQFRGAPWRLRQVYDSRALIEGPLLAGIEPRERIARIGWLSPAPPANAGKPLFPANAGHPSSPANAAPVDPGPS